MKQKFGRAHGDPGSKVKTILIVDDEIDITDTFTLLFEMNGFKVFSASNGRDALDIAKTHAPDLILSDCMMPVMDGLAFAREIRHCDATKDIPLVLMSAVPHWCDFSEVGVHEFIQKPFRFAALLERVNALLGIRS